MNFGDLVFWEQLCGALFALLLIRFVIHRTGWDIGRQIDRPLLLVLSLYLFSQIDLRSLLFFLFVSGFSYFGAAVFSHASQWVKRAALAVLIPIMFLPLLYYKYSGFLLHQSSSPVLGIGIPIGLSFYTFQKVAFFVDTLAFSKPTPKLLDFMNFAAFFPQLVAGPIERRDDLLPQMQRFHFRFCASRIRLGIGWIILGLFFKCVIADNLASIAAFWQSSLDNPFSIWLSCVVFGFRIYYDFAGYSLTALGLARCLGIRLTLNFRSPYLSCGIQEFWRRWHITLCRWFRDYVYIPLGGNQVPWTFLNVLVVFGISGLWHGAGWNFILWGLGHGFLVLAQHLSRRAGFRVPVFIGWLGTNVLVFLLWLSFFETNLPNLAAKLETVFSPASYSVYSLGGAFRDIHRANLGYVLAVFALVACAHLAELLSERWWRKPYRAFHQTWVLCLMIGAIVWFTTGVQNEFIYFAF
jgi:D-alanyl-lipoteichoic acid acyltransferase DltB (MBOAT superfamily)